MLYGINAWAGGFLALGVERVRLLLREEEVALGCSGLGAVEKIMGGGGQIRFASTFGKCL